MLSPRAEPGQAPDSPERMNIPSRSYSEHLCLTRLNRLVFFSS